MINEIARGETTEYSWLTRLAEKEGGVAMKIRNTRRLKDVRANAPNSVPPDGKVREILASR